MVVRCSSSSSSSQHEHVGSKEGLEIGMRRLGLITLWLYYGECSGDGECKVETPIHDNIRELKTWECKEHGVKSCMC